MKKSFGRRLLAFLLVLIMLAGQLMTGFALTGDDDGIPMIFGGRVSDSSEDEETNENNTTDSSNNEDGGSIAIDEPLVEPVELTTDVPAKLNAAPAPQALEDGNGGITIDIQTTQGTFVHDGDTLTFTVYVDDEDLTTLPNIVDGSELVIQMPPFLTREHWETILTETSYFKDYRFDEATNTLTLIFKEPGGTYVSFAFNITTTVDTIGLEGEPSGDINVGLGGLQEGTNHSSIHVGVGTGTGEDIPHDEPYLKKYIWSNVKDSQYGMTEYDVVRDENRPIGYSLAIGVNENYSGTVTVSDNLSSGNLTLCNAQGTTGAAADVVQVLIGGTRYSNGDVHEKLGTITITDTKPGFAVSFSRSTVPEDAQSNLIDVQIRYYALLTGDANSIANSATLSIDGHNEAEDTTTIVKREDQGLFVYKTIPTANGDVRTINLDDDDTTVTFRINLSQVGLSNKLADGKQFVFDILEPCFIFNPDAPDAVKSNCDYFRLEQDGQRVNVVKNGDGTIPQGNYWIDFTVGINTDLLKNGMQATNVVGNPVYIRRPGKLSITKVWNGNYDIGKGARFELYYGTRLVASTQMSSGNAFTLLFWADDINLGKNTYTLKEIVDPNSEYVAHKDISVVIDKDQDNNITILTVNGVDYNAGTAAFTVENEPDSGVGSLTFKKFGDRVNNANLIGGGEYVLYRVTDSGDEPVGLPFTTEKGVIEFGPLEYGEYYVKEISAPDGYLLGSETSAHVTLKKVDPHQTINFVNTKYRDGEIKIVKVDDNGKPLANVEFTLIAPDGTKQTKRTNGEGSAIFKGLEAGNYSVKETVPVGYTGYEGYVQVKIDEKGTAKTIAIPENAAVVTAGSSITIKWKNVQLFGEIRIYKYGETQDKALSGAVFSLTGNGITKTAESDNNGVVIFSDIPYGTYTVTETKAPAGYVISAELSEGVTVVINSTNPVSLSYQNSSRLGSVTVIKRETNTEKPLAGAVFGLYTTAECISPYRTGVTGSDGKCTFNDLPSGMYYVKEISAPVGFVLSSEVRSFSVGVVAGSADEVWSHETTFDNSPKLYNVKLVKADETGNVKLPGAKFTLTGNGITGNGITKYAESDNNGVVIFSDIPYGTYTVTETEAPAGYVPSSPVTVTVGDNNTPAAYTVNQTVDLGDFDVIYNDHTRLTVYKVDDKNSAKGLPGTKFVIVCGDLYVTATGSGGVYRFTGLSEQGTEFVTTEQGTFMLEYVPMGSYVLKETEAPAGYIIATENTNFTISHAAESVTVGNTEIKGNLLLTKTDENGKLLGGVGFTISVAEGYVQATGSNGTYKYAGIGAEPYVMYTAANGTLSVSGLLWGVYTIDEDAATTPSGLIPEKGITFEITAEEHTKTIPVSVVNLRQVAEITLTKTDAQGKGLAGAVFQAVCISGSAYSDNEVRYAVSNADGVVKFSNLPAGVYEVKEYLAPEGKELSTEVYYLKAGECEVPENIVLSVLPVVCVNDDIPYTVVFKKVSTDGIPLTGMVFDVKDMNGKLIYESVAVNDPEGIELEIAVGDYYFIETKAPENYILNREPVRFTVTKTGKNEVVIENAPVTGSLTISKTDIQGTKLAGAEFAVYDTEDYYTNGINAKVLYALVTNSKGVASVNNIPFGSYTVVETKAPNGHELSAEPQSFVINDQRENAAVELAFVNEKCRYVFEVCKVDINNKAILLAGAEFLVYGEGIHVTVTTDETGKAVVEVPAPGTYSIIETKAPAGYTIDPNVYQVEVTEHTPENATIKAQFVSEDYPSQVLLCKIDEKGEILNDAVFQLYSVNGDTKTLIHLKTGENGYIYAPEAENTDIYAGVAAILNLPNGKYVLHEIVAPSDYMVLGDLYFVIDGSSYNEPLVITAPNLPYERGVAVCKENENGIRLAGAEFTLYDESKNELAVKTDASGYAYFGNLKCGDYVIKETSAPSGYKLSETEYQFSIGADGSLIGDGFVRYGTEEKPFFVLTVVDKPVTYSFEIVKISSVSSEKLDGAQFRIIGNGINETVTTEGGIAMFKNIPVGEYMLTETRAPAGYVLDPTGHFVRVTVEGVFVDEVKLEGETLSYTAVNDPMSFELSIIKQDEDSGKPLEGAAFTIVGPDREKYYLVTDENGRTGSISLLPGTYAVTESRAPRGYNVPLAGWSFTVEEGSMRLVKTEGNPDISFDNGVLTLTITNKRTTGSLLVYKHDSNGKDIPLAGAKFMLLDANANPVWFTLENRVYYAAAPGTEGAGNVITTNLMGEALLKDVEFGSYTLVEIQAPVGYSIKTEGVKLKLTDQSETLYVAVENEELKHEVTVLKLSDDDTPERLLGAVFTLYTVKDGKQDRFIADAITGYDGTAHFEVTYGDYVIVETKAPAGYELSKAEPVYFSFNDDTAEETFYFEFSNEKSHYTIEALKVDADTNEPLEGAVFAFTDSRGYVKFIETDENGIALFDDIAYDDYTVREVRAPYGYYINEDVTYVKKEQLKHGITVVVTVPDVLILGEVHLVKVDLADETKVLDAEFTVEDAEGNLLCWTPVEGGYVLSEEGETVIHAGDVTLHDIPVGDYVIREITAPDGYLMFDDSYGFTINAENAEIGINVKVKNPVRTVAFGLIKCDREDQAKRLAGAEFTLYTAVNGEKANVFDVVISDENGNAVFTDLTMGTYVLKETKAPYGYVPWEEELEVIVDKDGNVFISGIQLPCIDTVYMVKIGNECIRRELEITKIDEDSKEALAGAVFEITGPEKSWEVTSDAEGKVKLSLPYGEYVIKEIIAPDGHVLTEDVFVILVDDNGVSINGEITEEAKLIVENPSVKFELLIHKKTTKRDVPLSGAEFTVIGEYVDVTLTSGKDGNTESILLRPGEYVITETKAPKGYKLPKDSWKLTVGEDGTMTIEGKDALLVLNERVYIASIDNTPDFPKTGETGNRSMFLIGASMMLSSFSGLLFIAVDETKRRRLTGAK